MALRMIAAQSREQALAWLAQEAGLPALGSDGQIDPRLERLVQFERYSGGPRWWPFRHSPWGPPRCEIFVEAEVLGERQRPGRDQEAEARRYEMLEEELAALREGMTRLVRSADLARLPRCGKTLTECYDRLCAAGMLPELAQGLVLAARDELSGAAQEQATVVEATVRRQYEARLQLRTPHVIPGSGPLVIFLIGPTGVGKTTTVAKLAKRQALLEGRRVAVINTDMRRPGAQQQLELLLQPLELRVEATNRVASFTSLLTCLGDRDVILVDTAGVSGREHEQLEQTTELIRAAPRRQTFLVLSATTAYDEMNRVVAVHRSTGAGIDGVILAKLDETDARGAAATLASHCSIPIAYISAGRRAPQDLELATAERLSAMILPETESRLQRSGATHSSAPAGRDEVSAPSMAPPMVTPPHVVRRSTRTTDGQPKGQPAASGTKSGREGERGRQAKELVA